MGRHLLGFQAALPLGFLEAHENEIVAYQQRALDQHTVGGQQVILLLFAHRCQFVFEPQALIQQAAGVEKLL